MPARTRLLPLLPLRDVCVMPGTLGEALVGRETSLRAIEQSLRGGRLIFVATQKDPELDDPLPRDLYPIGTIARLEARIEAPNSACRVVVSGLGRGRLAGRARASRGITAGVREIEEPAVPRTSIEPRLRRAIDHLLRGVVAGEGAREQGLAAVARERELGRWCDRICPVVFQDWSDWIRILQLPEPVERLATLAAILLVDVLSGHRPGGKGLVEEIGAILGEGPASHLAALASRWASGREGRIRSFTRFFLASTGGR